MAGEEDETWLLALEAALPDCSDDEEIISITRGRTLPEEHRAQIWYLCLGGGNKNSSFSHFDEIFDLQEQNLVRADCHALVDKLGNEEEDKVSVICDVESIFTHYCKTRDLKYQSSSCWSDLVTPLLAAKMSRDHVYFCFQEILEKYIPRDSSVGGAVYHLLRLLLLYHDPQLSTFLDSRKITPDLYATTWVRSLFASVCSLDSVLAVWDIYLQEKDPFFILFLSLVILVNAREQVLAMEGESREHIISTLSSIPSGLCVGDVSDFCSLARYHVIKTPATFKRDFAQDIFGSVYLGGGQGEERGGGLPLSQALCLPVSPEEIIATCHSHALQPQDMEQVRFFLVDCRPAEQYNAGHLPTAFHLDAGLMLQQPSSFQTAVQGLLLAQRGAVAALTPGCGQHLCFIGSGRETEDQYVYMVVASFLQRYTPFVSLAKGGYQGLHDLLVHNLSENLTEHDPKRCVVCAPGGSGGAGGDTDHFSAPAPAPTSPSSTPMTLPPSSAAPHPQGPAPPTLINKFSSLSSVFKSRSAEMKEKLVEYITNPNSNNEALTADRHVSSLDRGRKLYRNQADVFSIADKDEEDQPLEGLEEVDINKWLAKPDLLASFTCHQVKENGYMYKSHLLLTESLLLVLRETSPPSATASRQSTPPKSSGLLVARRSLSSIVKITSKKRHPDFITFKYGSTTAEEEVLITDMDRFLIPNASQATKTIKDQIMKQIMEAAKT